MPYPALNDIVITQIDLHHASGKRIPANTVGVVCGCSANGLLQVNFGDLGVKYMSSTFLDVIGFVESSQTFLVGQDMSALVKHLSEENQELRTENQRLHDQLSDLLKPAPSRLAPGNGNGTHSRAPRSDN